MYIENSTVSVKKLKKYPNNTFVLGCNFGPYNSEKYFLKVKDIFKHAKDVCFRENYSYSLFKELPNVRKAPDIVFSLPIEQYNQSTEKKVIFSVISCEHKLSKEFENIYIQKILEMIDFFIEHEYKVVLMSFCDLEGDKEAIKKIMNRIAKPNDIDCFFYHGNIEDAKSLIASSKIIVGSRFHANILGLLYNKTIIPIIYSDKTKNVLSDLAFHSLILEIEKMSEFDTSQLTDKVLNYHLDVSLAKEESIKHFERLDGYLNES